MISFTLSPLLVSQVFTEFADVPLPDVHITHVCFDSREVCSNSAFIALGSVAGKRDDYIATALESGALVIFYDTSEGDLPLPLLDERCIGVTHLKQKIGEWLHRFYGDATERMSVIGITGTNGKSSISFYLSQLLEVMQSRCAVMGTLGYGHPDDLIETGMTTLPLEKLHGALADLSTQYSAVAMEVSSHGLHQNRLAGVRVTGAIFCNLSRDHLDYHGTMDAYAEAKAALFKRPELSFAVINGDDEYAGIMASGSTANTVIHYGQNESCDVCFTIKAISESGLLLTVQYKQQQITETVPLYGAFNAYNAIAAVATVVQLGYSFDDAMSALPTLRPVTGRMQKVSSPVSQPLVLVDYAHTPDALEQVLSTCRQHCTGRLVVVVGCGGDRDQGKRPLMGEIAARYADSVLVTSDNPRTESPVAIIEQMVVNLSPTQYHIQIDRALAIKSAIEQAKVGDLVLIAGKGHENYQEINGQRTYFSDIDAAKAVLEEHL